MPLLRSLNKLYPVVYCICHILQLTSAIRFLVSTFSSVLFLWLQNWLIRNNSCTKSLQILNINFLPTCHSKSTIWIWAVSTKLSDIQKLDIKSTFSKICVGFSFPPMEEHSLPFLSLHLCWEQDIRQELYFRCTDRYWRQASHRNGENSLTYEGSVPWQITRAAMLNTIK